MSLPCDVTTGGKHYGVAYESCPQGESYIRWGWHVIIAHAHNPQEAAEAEQVVMAARQDYNIAGKPIYELDVVRDAPVDIEPTPKRTQEQKVRYAAC